MARGVPHSPELHAEVVAAARAGTSVRQAARQFGLDAGLISRWVAAEPAVLPTVTTDQAGSDDLTKLTALIADHLRETLRAMSSTRTARQ
jgi:hypothetical protein